MRASTGHGVLSIERIDVAPDHLEARIRVLSRVYEHTSASPALAARAVGLLPGIAAHSCDNGAGNHVVTELADTQSAHLLEHVAVELMVRSGSPRGLGARTSWDFSRDGAGVYRVWLGFDHDIVAIAALKEAQAICEWLLRPLDRAEPDVAEAVKRISAART